MRILGFEYDKLRIEKNSYRKVVSFAIFVDMFKLLGEPALAIKKQNIGLVLTENEYTSGI